MISDVHEILGKQNAGEGQVTAESIMNPDAKKIKKPPKKPAEPIKKPEGMHRELFNLLVIDKNQASPLMPSLTQSQHGGYRNSKARLGLRKVREWKMTPFTNPAREDNLTLSHWCRADRIDEPYPFARFNKAVQVPSYSDEEYNRLLATHGWNKAETDYLMELALRFDLRWIIVHDRWDRERFQKKRSVEDLKERYYNIYNTLLKSRASPDVEPELLKFDADHERRRKLQLEKLWNRTEEQVKEEEKLQADLRKIEVRRKERERKAQDLQKLITAADRPPSVAPSPAGGSMQKKKLPKASRQATAAGPVPSPGPDAMSGLKFPEFKASGPYLRSQRMKLPQQAGQKKLKAVELAVGALELEHNPIATEDIVTQFNELRSDIVLLYDLKSALTACEYELETQKHQYAATTGKDLEIPPNLRVVQLTETSPKRPIAGSMEASQQAAPTRRRRAALEQPTVLKKLRRNT